MTALRFCLPVATVLPVAIIAMTPWRAPDYAEFALPLITLVVIYYWAERRPKLMPGAIAFLAGIATDLVTDGPVGYWSLLYLLAVVGGASMHRRRESGRPMLNSWHDFTFVLAAILAIAWSIASLYYLEPVPWKPMALGGVLAVLAYPVMALALGPIDTHLDDGEELR